MFEIEALATHNTLREEALRVIRSGIIAGDIQAGEIYSAPALAARLKVSATPIREAMLDLISEGLVEPVRNRGFRVIALTRQDFDEILQLQVILEPEMTAAAIGRVPPAVADKLRSLAQQTVQDVARGDLPSFIENERSFHELLLSCSGNARAVDLLSRLRDQIRRYGLIPVGDRESLLLTTAQEHELILNAVVAGDRTLTEELMRTHLGRGRQFAEALADGTIDSDTAA
jgi:DNA-binding GntR family transcriptional regulator